MGWEVGCHWSVTASCCSLLVSCASSSACAGWLAVGSNWASHSWNCWKCSCNTYIMVEVGVLTVFNRCLTIMFRYTMAWWCFSQLSTVLGSRCILSVIVHGILISISHCHVVIFVGFSILVEQSFRGDCLQFGTSVCGSVVVLRMREKSITRQWLCWASLVVINHALWKGSPLHLLCRYCQLFHCEVSHHSTSVKVQNGYPL